MAGTESQAAQARTAAPTPMMEQYWRLKGENPGALLFFRLGDFYELFHQDAELAAPILDVQLTSRDGQVPMCGVPHHAVMGYIERLIAAGHTVALAEQMEDPRQVKGLVDRQVVRIFSPGTFVPGDAPAVPRLAVLLREGRGWTLVVGELATGVLYIADQDGLATDRLAEHVGRLRPAETLTNWPDALAPELLGRVLDPAHWFGPTPKGVALERELACRLGTATLAGWGLDGMHRAGRALSVLFRYLDFTQKQTVSHFSVVHRLDAAQGLRLSPAAAKSLDLVQDGGPSLYGVLNRTKTAMGARLLRDWLLSPLSDPRAIAARQGEIQRWQADPIGRAAIRERLGRVGDLARRVSRVALGLGSPRDLTQLRAALVAAEEIRGRDADAVLSADDQAVLARIGDLLGRIADPPPARFDDPGVIRPGVDPDLDRARDLAGDHRAALAALEQAERERSGIRSLRLGYHRTFGYHWEISRAQADRVPEGWVRRQSMTRTERYTSEPLMALEAEILASDERARLRERSLIDEILAAVREAAPLLNRESERLQRLDVVTALAEVAVSRHYAWPRWITEVGPAQIRFSALRHAVLETVEPHYVPSDFAPEAGKRVIVLTGPNMGGKSTFMRAVAIAVLLAHIGMAVPADGAELTVMDGIYTRIGADDDLFRGQSTFMAELEEVAYIVRKATDRSLVLLDELGRGTSTYDGMALASAVIDHLAQDPGPFTLFATHYHELTGLAERRPSVANWTAEVLVPPEGGLVFTHRVRPGAADRSYGLDVARLAGLPRIILERARSELRRYEAAGPESRGPEQLTLFRPDPVAAEIMSQLENLDPDELTPRDAWRWMADWHQRLRRAEEGGSESHE